MASTAELQAKWTKLYSETLPALARARDPAQFKWPVTVDHCFARIILDNTIGEGRQPWDRNIKKPATRNMSEEQLRAAIELAEEIKAGTVDLVALDLQSLEARGKAGKKYGDFENAVEEDEMTEVLLPSSEMAHTSEKERKYRLPSTAPQPSTTKQRPAKRQSTLPFSSSSSQPPSSKKPRLHSSQASDDSADETQNLDSILHQISAHPGLTPYRKRLYSTLCSVPRGQYTTYAAMSGFLDSSARAVGNGMRRNPFAPAVPCHRVLAADGTIGGFKGGWGKDGEYASQKITLLRAEGVRFDGSGKVVGAPFRDFVDLSRVK